MSRCSDAGVLCEKSLRPVVSRPYLCSSEHQLRDNILHTRNRHLRNQRGFSVAFVNGLTVVFSNGIYSFQWYVPKDCHFSSGCLIARRFPWALTGTFQQNLTSNDFWCLVFRPDDRSDTCSSLVGSLSARRVGLTAEPGRVVARLIRHSRRPYAVGVWCLIQLLYVVYSLCATSSLCCTLSV